MTDRPLLPVTPVRVTALLAGFCFLSVIVVNGLLWLLSPAGYQETALHHTLDVLHARSGDDSWGPMALALEYLAEPGPKPLYAALFFEGGIKFQYPPSALFALLAMFLAGPERVRISDDMAPAMWPAVNDLMGWGFILVMIACCAGLLEVSLKRNFGAEDWRRLRIARIVIVAIMTLTFYPFVKGFTLGQVQLWINAAFAAALLLFALQWRAGSGLVIGVLSLLKPHYGLIALWGLRNREWRFAGAAMLGAITGLALSIWAFGLANHLDYLSVVSFMAEHGESYYPNHSVNGLLNRFIGRSLPELYPNAEYGNGGFPPYNGWVYWPALVASAVILVSALLRRSDDAHRLISLCLMAVSVTIAAPIAWEHHYGLLLPVYAVAFPALATSRAGLLWLALSYLLLATFIASARLLAPTIFNVFQSYMLFGSIILLSLLHGLLPFREVTRGAQPKPDER
jgi:hypothetical protein